MTSSSHDRAGSHMTNMLRQPACTNMKPCQTFTDLVVFVTFEIKPNIYNLKCVQMAKNDVVVLKNLKTFLDRLNSTGIHVTKAYLFGSYLTGRTDEWSDIDVAVISPQISDDRFEERVNLTKIAVTIDDRIEPLPFNPANFTKDDPLVLEIINKGLALECSIDSI